MRQWNHYTIANSNLLQIPVSVMPVARLLWQSRSFINTSISKSATITQSSACHSISVFGFDLRHRRKCTCTYFQTSSAFLVRTLSVCETYLCWKICRSSLQSNPEAPNLGYIYPQGYICLSEGVHLRLSTDDKYMFAYDLFPNIYTCIS